MIKSRVIVTQGPAQMLAVLSVLRYLAKSGEHYQDYLVIGGIGIEDSPDYQTRLVQATRLIADSWKWKKIIDLCNKVPFFAPEIDFQEHLATEVRNEVDAENVDYIFVVRNWQSINQVIFRAFPYASIICYGDGFGVIDTSNEIGYRRPDRIYVTIPVEARRGALSESDHLILDKSILASVIDEVANSLISMDVISGINCDRNQSSVLALLENLTEANIMRFDEEVGMYISMIKPFLSSDSMLYIKPHPREHLGQHKAVSYHFKQHGWHVVELTEGILGQLPVELLFRSLNFDRVVGMFSCAAWNLHFLYNSPLYYTPQNEFDVLSDRVQRFVREQIRINTLFIYGYDNWRGIGPISCHEPWSKYFFRRFRQLLRPRTRLASISKLLSLE